MSLIPYNQSIPHADPQSVAYRRKINQECLYNSSYLPAKDKGNSMIKSSDCFFRRDAYFRDQENIINQYGNSLHLVEILWNDRIFANVALLKYPNGEIRYVLVKSGTKKLDISNSNTDSEVGQRKRLCDIQEGSMIFNIESPSLYGELVCQSGFPAQLILCNKRGLAVVLMPSGEIEFFDRYHNATIHDSYSKIPENASSTRLILEPVHSQFSNVSKSIPQRFPSNPESSDNYDWRLAIKIVSIVGLSILGFFLSRRITLFWDSSADISTAVSIEDLHAPCNIILSEDHRPIVTGNCVDQDIDDAFEKFNKKRIEKLVNEKRLREERYQRLLEDGKKEAAEHSAKVQEKIDKVEADWAERVRRWENPTPEEHAEDLAEIHKEMDKKFAGWVGHVRHEASKPERQECQKDKAAVSNAEDYRHLTDIERVTHSTLNSYCKKDAAIILGVSENDDCGEIRKQYYKISQVMHPDKNPMQKKLAAQAFFSASTAYETLCKI